jgi:hypothetical protein
MNSCDPKREVTAQPQPPQDYSPRGSLWDELWREIDSSDNGSSASIVQEVIEQSPRIDPDEYLRGHQAEAQGE